MPEGDFVRPRGQLAKGVSIYKKSFVVRVSRKSVHEEDAMNPAIIKILADELAKERGERGTR
jgi:hypothetical protein